MSMNVTPELVNCFPWHEVDPLLPRYYTIQKKAFYIYIEEWSKREETEVGGKMQDVIVKTEKRGCMWRRCNWFRIQEKDEGGKEIQKQPRSQVMERQFSETKNCYDLNPAESKTQDQKLL